MSTTAGRATTAKGHTDPSCPIRTRAGRWGSAMSSTLPSGGAATAAPLLRLPSITPTSPTSRCSSAASTPTTTPASDAPLQQASTSSIRSLTTKACSTSAVNADPTGANNHLRTHRSTTLDNCSPLDQLPDLRLEVALGAADLGEDRGGLLQVGQGLLVRSEEHTSELQSRENLVCRLLLEK